MPAESSSLFLARSHYHVSFNHIEISQQQFPVFDIFQILYFIEWIIYWLEVLGWNGIYVAENDTLAF